MRAGYWIIGLLITGFGWCVPVRAELTFPALSGRVVDQAGLLNPSTRQQLDRQLEAHEKASGNQVVVVTLKNLQGTAIEDYGYQLGRAWGIGQDQKNNGVLLIVAPQERQVRIEVGYGLEGTLTDALSSNIIQAVILPHFRQGNFEEGIVAGAQAVIQALGGQYQLREPRGGSSKELPWWVIFFIPLILLRRMRWWGGYGLYGYHGHQGGRRGGGFSGGGGSFGGGGASGGW